MERKIGEKFKYKEHVLEVVERKSCEGCFFYNDTYCMATDHHYTNILGFCFNRMNGKTVIFKEV